MATTGALMVDPNTGELVLVSSVTFLDCNGGDDGLQSIYLPLVSMAAVFHPYCLISNESLRQFDSETDTPYELEMSNEPGCWGEEDFKLAEIKKRGRIHFSFNCIRPLFSPSLKNGFITQD